MNGYVVGSFGEFRRGFQKIFKLNFGISAPRALMRSSGVGQEIPRVYYASISLCFGAGGGIPIGTFNSFV